MTRLESTLIRGVRIATACSVSSSLLPDVFMLHVFIPPRREISATPDTTYYVFAFGSSTSCALGRMSCIFAVPSTYLVLYLATVCFQDASYMHLHTPLLLWLLHYSHNYLKYLYITSGYAITFTKYLYTLIGCTVLVC